MSSPEQHHRSGLEAELTATRKEGPEDLMNSTELLSHARWKLIQHRTLDLISIELQHLHASSSAGGAQFTTLLNAPVPTFEVVCGKCGERTQVRLGQPPIEGETE